MMIFPVSLLEEQMDDDHVTGGDETQERSTANKDIPSHARKPKKQGNGMCWSFHFALYSFADHVYHIFFIC